MKTLFYFLLLFCFIASCNQSSVQEKGTSIILSDTTIAAVTPLLTTDEKGRPLLWWIEKQKESTQNLVMFAVSNDTGTTFEKPTPIPSTLGCNDGHGQGMPKMIVKADGTMLVVYHMKVATEDNPYAGKIYYSQSFDQGKSWETPRTLHQDTLKNNSHGYPALTLLPNGEVAAAWLDGRNKLPYSEMFLSITDGRKGFSKETKIGGPTCQCCKLDFYTDKDQQVHLLYRGIMEDNIRDIMHIVSSDTGKNFTEPTRISKDGWKIKGCPHAGPGITLKNDSLHYVWFTMGGGEGIFYCSSDKKGTAYSTRENLAKGIAKYPQITTTGNNKIAITWQEYDSTSLKGQSYTRVKLQLRNNEEKKSFFVTENGITSSHPSLLSLDKNLLLLAYEQLLNNRTVIAYKKN